MENDDIHFNVLGTFVSLPIRLCTKYPESRLAQIARRPPHQNDAAYIPCDPEGFQIMTRYLHTERLIMSNQISLATVKEVFNEMEIPFPSDYQYHTGLPTSTHSSSSYGVRNSNPPPYTSGQAVELVASLPSSFSSHQKSPSEASLQDVLRQSVQNRLTNLLLEYLMPLIRTQARSGIYRAAFVLVPSDITPLNNNNQRHSMYSPRSISPPVEDVISLVKTPISEIRYLRIVRLEGQENSLAFLTQPPVVDELKRQLLDALGPEKVAKNTQVSPGKVSFMNRLSRGYSKNSISDAEKRKSIEIQQQTQNSRLKVDVEEISIRRENSMGLWETVAGEAVVVQVLL